jgi:hypothetical protein
LVLEQLDNAGAAFAPKRTAGLVAAEYDMFYVAVDGRQSQVSVQFVDRFEHGYRYIWTGRHLWRRF